MNYTQSRTYELISFYIQLATDVKTLKGGTCDLECPENWTKGTEVCSCQCNINKCEIATQSVDIYNCKCVNNNGCQLTSKSCAETGNKLLDYTKCECKYSNVIEQVDF